MLWSQESERLKSEICTILTRIGALKFGAFALASGLISPYYIDLRVVPSFPEVFQRVCGIYIEMVKNVVGLKKFERVAGIPTAGVPFASVVAYSLGKPFVYVRREVKTHGRERRVEGILTPGDRVLLLDDLITTGGSLLDAVQAIRAEGGVVKDAIVLIDREEGGRKALAKSRVKLYSLVKMSEVAKKLYEVGALNEDQLRNILGQIKK